MAGMAWGDRAGRKEYGDGEGGRERKRWSWDPRSGRSAFVVVVVREYFNIFLYSPPFARSFLLYLSLRRGEGGGAGKGDEMRNG
jgi:hypothetical protein